MRDKLLAGIDDPYVKAHVSENIDREIAVRRHDTANAAFRLESSDRRGTLDTDLDSTAKSAAGASNDLLRAKLTDDGVASIKGAVAGGWLDPESGDKAIIGFKSQVQEVQVRKQANGIIDAQDGAAAHALADKLNDSAQFKDLLPEKREIILQKLENLSYRLDTRAATALAHADSVADRNLHRGQARNEATLLAGVNAGKPLSDSDIEHLADTQQISAGGVEALHSAKMHAENGNDEPASALRLWHAIGTKQATSDMIFDAQKTGDISKSTSFQMMRALDAKTSKQDDAVTRQSFADLKSALHGGAIEQGIIPNKSPEAAAWAQAQGEWTNRVTIGGESATKVRDDMLQRYAHDTASPTWLPQPRLGLVQSPQDLASVAAATGAALKSGKITPDQYQSELRLLSQYKQFYPLQTKKPAPGAKP